MPEVAVKPGYYRCTSRNCFHAGRYYEEGDFTFFDSKRLPPMKKDGRINHFVFVGTSVPKEEPESGQKGNLVTGSVDVSSLSQNGSPGQQR